MTKENQPDANGRKPLRLLMVEDSEDDVLLTIHALKKGGYEPTYERVEDAEAMREALETGSWDVILCDYHMPKFDGLAAIALLKETETDIPLIIISGAIGEETAVKCMRLGARDYVMKNNLPRLASAVERELKETESRCQRKQADDVLKASEEHHRTILQTAMDGIWLMDIQGSMLEFNEAYCLMSGYSAQELSNMNISDLEAAETEDETAAHIQNIIVQGQDRFESRHRRKDGSIIDVEICANYQPTAGGQIVVFLRDITDRKRAVLELIASEQRLRKAVTTTIQVMVATVEARDPYTAGHQIRSANLARAIATEMGFPPEKVEGIRIVGSIHDIGKISIPAEILSKPTKLSDIEFSLIKEHSRLGFEMLKNVESTWPLAEIIYQHHELMDGSGYPRNLKGEEICIEARILTVADVVEAMASHRPYRAGLGIEAALEEIEKNKGVLYDVAVADACLRLFREKGFQLEGA